ncbi:GHKL domain-containing protein [Paraneptunicella aestuarii]|uniref:sensor histidine kinase n=1 Tax=Paraneptunicella aestuarii TaxID=2831148 RepID=UPI001E3FD211|nr:ATP-binding protein [Paraneptunicella aestuarii]UAA40374.1 GHKL domain-containing protein [Paraneptunicella aestuarii]
MEKTVSKQPSFESQLTRLSLLASLPLLTFLLWIMFYEDISIWLILLMAFVEGMLVLYTNHQIHQKVVHQFRSLINLLDAMQQGDYSLRARSEMSKGMLGEVYGSVNNLAERLSQQRIETKESQLLVRTVLDHIDVAIVALTDDNQILFFNPAAQHLLSIEHSRSNEKLLQQLAFAQSFESGRHEVVELSLGHHTGRFNVHVEEYMVSGIQHKLLFITDVSTLLRSEESKAWQSLVRVISHEINNSLSPIASISQTLNRMISRQGVNDDNLQDLLDGLSIISQRASGLSKFVDSYKLLAKLPEPQLECISLIQLLDKTRQLFNDQNIEILSTEDVRLMIDPVQFEQVLINLIKNAVEAMAATKPKGVIRVAWTAHIPVFRLTICDEGAGISNPDNLFVPFYSTKKSGSGIGLVLCRQIIEAHRGRLTINNNLDSAGCCASIELPFRHVQENKSLQEHKLVGNTGRAENESSFDEKEL